MEIIKAFNKEYVANEICYVGQLAFKIVGEDNESLALNIKVPPHVCRNEKVLVLVKDAEQVKAINDMDYGDPLRCFVTLEISDCIDGAHLFFVSRAYGISIWENGKWKDIGPSPV